MKRYLISAGLAALVVASLAPAWWVKGHASIAEAATLGLPADVPAFFRAGGKLMGHYAGDPDRWKNPSARHLRAAEAPDHYLDLENYQGKELPADRYKAIVLLLELKQKPEQTGMLPYAILEHFERLCCAFKDYRDDPKDPAIQAKCLVYAGTMAHYTGDLAMPLHTTVNFDGRKDAEGKLVQKGIHARIDAFPERNGLTAEEIARDLKARPIEGEAWAHVLKMLKDSHAQIERCYALDKTGAIEQPTDESRKFILERCRAGAQLTMDLWYTAWLRSATMPKHY